jgi:heme A synthase
VKLFLTIISLGVIYYGIMETGDSKSLFINLIVFYAMYLHGYFEIKKKYEGKIFSAMLSVLWFMVGVCFFGLIGMITVQELNKNYVIKFSETMRLTQVGLNIHIFFLILLVLTVVFSAMEWIMGKYKEQEADLPNAQKKGA